MSTKVFIDGHEGTTGLELSSQLQGRSDIELLSIDSTLRKDIDAKRKIYKEADVVVLCLPDSAAREAASLFDQTRFLDASTAHRTDPNWTYGLPEIDPDQRQRIADSARVSNPGCYPTGFLLSIKPLIDSKMLSRDTLIRTHAVSGYSGGGKKLIKSYTKPGCHTSEARPYSMNLVHKHVPEMQCHSGLTNAPLFEPMVGGFYRGMLVQTPLFVDELERPLSRQELLNLYKERYSKEFFVHVVSSRPEDELDQGFLSPQRCNGTNRIDIMIFGHDQQFTITARLDNLGKGASMAAIQNLNLMLGLNESTGLPA